MKIYPAWKEFKWETDLFNKDFSFDTNLTFEMPVMQNKWGARAFPEPPPRAPTIVSKVLQTFGCVLCFLCLVRGCRILQNTRSDLNYGRMAIARDAVLTKRCGNVLKKLAILKQLQTHLKQNMN